MLQYSTQHIGGVGVLKSESFIKSASEDTGYRGKNCHAEQTDQSKPPSQDTNFYRQPGNSPQKPTGETEHQNRPSGGLYGAHQYPEAARGGKKRKLLLGIQIPAEGFCLLGIPIFPHTIRRNGRIQIKQNGSKRDRVFA